MLNQILNKYKVIYIGFHGHGTRVENCLQWVPVVQSLWNFTQLFVILINGCLQRMHSDHVIFTWLSTKKRFFRSKSCQQFSFERHPSKNKWKLIFRYLCTFVHVSATIDAFANPEDCFEFRDPRNLEIQTKLEASNYCRLLPNVHFQFPKSVGNSFKKFAHKSTALDKRYSRFLRIFEYREKTKKGFFLHGGKLIRRISSKLFLFNYLICKIWNGTWSHRVVISWLKNTRKIPRIKQHRRW